MNKKILNLAKDILLATSIEMPQYKEFLLEQERNLDIGEIEYTGVGMYINLNKPKFSDKTIPDGYLSSNKVPSKTIKFDTIGVDFDFIVTCHDGYVNLVEIVAPSSLDFWNGKFDTYEFIDN